MYWDQIKAISEAFVDFKGAITAQEDYNKTESAKNESALNKAKAKLNDAKMLLIKRAFDYRIGDANDVVLNDLLIQCANNREKKDFVEACITEVRKAMLYVVDPDVYRINGYLAGTPKSTSQLANVMEGKYEGAKREGRIIGLLLGGLLIAGLITWAVLAAYSVFVYLLFYWYRFVYWA
jgi:hypothetical protein